MITLDGIKVVFGRHQVLDGVSFTVAAGESYGLLGESGSGKSTILRAIAGLVPIAAGGISVDGRALRANGARDGHFFRDVQMVFQDPYGSLHPRHTVDRVLGEALQIQGFGDREQRIRQALSDVGLDLSHRYRYPHQLSGGQRQRIAIARALITEPKVLLLDEPTSALDVSVQAEILNLLQDLRRERGLTYLFVSHNLPVVAHVCDRVAILAEGVLAEEVSAPDLARGAVDSAVGKAMLLAAEGYQRLPLQRGTVTSRIRPAVEDSQARPADIVAEDIVAVSYQLSAGLR